MRKLYKKSNVQHFPKVLALSISVIMTSMVATSVSQASDIDIYQDAKSGDITLMFMLDISGSMSRYNSIELGYACDLPSGVRDSGRDRSDTSKPFTNGPEYRRQWCKGNDGKNYMDRITRVKDAMITLLKGYGDVTKLSDDKIIGLSTLGVYDGSTYRNTGAVLVPARRLDANVDKTTGEVKDKASNNTETQRDILIHKIAGFNNFTNTPTARSFAETIAYFMGTNTSNTVRVDAMPLYRQYVSGSSTYLQKCTAWNNTYSVCNTWSNTTDALPTWDELSEAKSCQFTTYSSSWSYNGTQRNGQCYDYTGVHVTSLGNSGFSYSSDTTKNTSKTTYITPDNLLSQREDLKQCNGQGVYVLTDGEPTQDEGSLTLMQNALGNKGTVFSCNNTSFDCLNKLSLAILDPNQNPVGLKFKTAVVGFGNSFNDPTLKYDTAKSQAENIAALGTINTDVKRAAYWGIIGEGGWYSGNSSKDVVDSVNAFINSLSTEIPAMTTGAPAIPVDRLNPAALQKHAYYQQFQPTPNLTHQSWLGNLKKFSISSSGKLQGKNNVDVIDTDGRLITPTYDKNDNITSAVYDLWAADVVNNVVNADENTVGSRKFATRGGVWSKLGLGEHKTVANTAARKLLTNRKGSGSGTSATFSNSASLQRINLNYITDTLTKNDPYRGHLVSLLGYNVDVTNIPTSIDSLKAQPHLRQVGATMHSTPLLLTTEGNIDYDTTTQQMVSTNRKDYTLFGTTQGLLHVVDAETGQEKFAFVPNEMVENQRDAFRLSTLTNGGLNKLYYGIDAPWTVYSEYVINSSNKLTVGSGKTTQQQGKLDVYGGLRMGGRSYYALDLADIDNPSLKFHINPADQKVYSGSTPKNFTQLQYMGQSWSKPTITWMNWGGKRTRVMFVGGGYDAGGTDGDARVNGVKGAYDGYENPEYNQTNKIGAGVYMFDAENGDLLWWASDNVSSSTATDVTTGVIATKDANLKYSVVSEIRTVDRNGDDLVDHIYFGDLGGQLFRIDFDNTKSVMGAVPQAPIRLLNLNVTGGKSPRFYDMPAFSLYNHNGTNFAAVSIGSGNRSTPLKDYTSDEASVSYDAIYNIYDKDVARRDLFTNETRATRNLGINDLGEITDSNRGVTTTQVAPFSSKHGWFYRFKNCNNTSINPTATNICSNYKKQSEKVFGTPLAMKFKLYVSTFDASKPGISGDCGAGVKGESYASTFCMPYGQCSTSIPDVSLGYGIQTIVTGPKDITGTGGSTGDDTEGGTDGGAGGSDFNKVSYCVANDGRSAFSSAGAFGEAVKSKLCLIPQRWYEQLGKI